MTKYNELKTKQACIQRIREMVGTNEKWALRALVRIYERQTSDEQASETTHHHNSVGFTGSDATILTSLARQTLAGRTLSQNQMAIVFKKMPKYARQLEEIASNK